MRALALAAALALPLTLAQAMAQVPVVPDARLEASIAAAFNAPDRPLQARLGDAERHIATLLRMTGARPGMRALDVGSGSGTLALLLASMVGETGHVDIHNTPGWLVQFPSMEPVAMKARIRRDNIGYIVERWSDLGRAPGPYDVIVMGQVYHDTWLEGADAAAMDRQLFALLKPGGRLVIEDHDALPEMPLAQQVYLHRIAESQMTKEVLAAGFVLAERLPIESKYDDRRFNVFKPGVRGRTDRYIVSFVKPQAAP
jgi:predicted methyltransferase